MPLLGHLKDDFSKRARRVVFEVVTGDCVADQGIERICVDQGRKRLADGRNGFGHLGIPVSL
jgi:hypothetical protein